MTPLASWALFLVCVAVGVTVYVVVVARLDRREREWDVSTPWQSATHSTTDGYVRVMGGIYDHEARGDFDR